jgi:NADPH2:quinone reductase
VAGRGLRITGCGGPTWFRQVFDVHNPEFLDLPARGATHHQPVDSVLPPADAAEAHRRLDSGAHTGRILLVP